MLYWNHIIGHDRIKTVLSSAIERDRLHHGYLFSGPHGVGKFSFALALAATLNCDRRAPGTFAPSCGECSSCKRTSSRQHPDLHFIAPTGTQIKTIKIEAIRELQRICISKPFEKGYRFVFIDDAHYMSEEAANALLKTLEEPPERTVLVVITDQPHRLLETILSRCQLMRFGSLKATEVSAALEKIYTLQPPFDAAPANSLLDPEEDKPSSPPWEVPEKELFSVAAGYGEGSLGRSLEMLEKGILQERRELVDRLLFVDPASQIAWLEGAQFLNDSVQGLKDKLDLLTVFFRDLMFFQHSGSHRIVNEDLEDLLAALSDRYSSKRLLEILESLMDARMRIQYSVSGQLLAEDIIYRLRPS